MDGLKKLRIENIGHGFVITAFLAYGLLLMFHAILGVLGIDGQKYIAIYGIFGAITVLCILIWAHIQLTVDIIIPIIEFCQKKKALKQKAKIS